MDKRYYLTLMLQKMIAVGMIVLSVLFIKSGFFYDEISHSNDCTFMLMLIPMAAYMLFTKTNHFYQNEWS